MAETKLTPLYLKTVAQKFDLETVTILKLREKNIQGNVGSLGECVNALYVDLSKNRLTVISGMENLNKLKVLNLSYNKLTTCDALKGCVSLMRLELQGNLLKDTKPIERIEEGLTNLVGLYLQEFNGEASNPCCRLPNYKDSVRKALPSLKALDGQRLNLGDGLDMKNLGIEDQDGDNLEDLLNEYSASEIIFYSEELERGCNSDGPKMGATVRAEV